ncbi:UDP-glucuronosyltransferase 2B1-like [Denticeps clupeoides]|uniref:UDP-glucuronosyltransferase 2B1-like n=1 Tax=Denticeps clupeoides TaxID=299321 RepID=UPI0010A497D3|nr:UDP-glucuronosyltransferase 2B1-like [Denticeps clupeoides]
MDILVKALHSKGHSVSVLRASKSWYIKEESSYYNSITVSVTEGFDEEFVIKALSKLFSFLRSETSLLKFINFQFEMFSTMSSAHARVCEMITNMIEDKGLMKKLNESQFDLVLADPAWGAGAILAHYLQIPLVFNVRWTTNGEGHFDIAPSPLSYIPLTGSGFSDKMTFTERVKNILHYSLLKLQNNVFIKPQYQAICDKYFQTKLDFTELQQAADIWLMRVDFVFEFPRPTMPNVVYMGGFQCKPSNPLPQDLEVFVQSAGDHGIIIMSLGTFVGQLPKDVAADLTDEIAAAFAEMPQKVIWRHTGDKPATLGNNTLLVNWLPQNDLLGHPKVKAFVAHGGTNGVQEALYHGVPVVGLPLFFDQYDNLFRLQERGGAKIIPPHILDKTVFLQALQEVLHDPSYRMNMQRLSRLHKDQPMKPLDQALFWIEFVMRHKGAAHLRTESYKMPWYSYHSLDVIGFLAIMAFTAVFFTVFIVRCICCRILIKPTKVKLK